MGAMANHKIFLKLFKNPLSRKWSERRYRQGLIHFFEALSLHVKAGFALSYSWPETIASLEESICERLRGDLASKTKEAELEDTVGEILKILSRSCWIASYQIWFGVVSELYESGAPLSQAVEAIATTLRREQERDLEAHCRSLPMKVNVTLMIFFLPPTFLFLFGPLVLEILSQFK